MMRFFTILLASVVLTGTVYSQNIPGDTAILKNKYTTKDSLDILLSDTTLDYDLLLKDLDSFLDSILTPSSYFLGNVSIGKGFFNFERKSSLYLQTDKKLTYSPSLGYYNKSGLGLTATGYMVNDDVNMNLYQFSISPSFDFLKNKKLATGFSYTRYFTKDSLPFYTSPLQNELYAYFTWRKFWVRPSVQISYGWGSRSEYQEREELITSLRLRPRGYTFINTTESVSDFSLTGSLRKDIYWLDVFTNNDHIRFTPQATITFGTQKFGFNQSSATYAQILRSGANVLYNSENIYLDDKLNFQPLSWSFLLKGEYSVGKFFVQPQLIFDYYYPATSNNFSTLFTVNLGFMF
jgi:hypothetical protein